jgi:hypothetical protein
MAITRAQQAKQMLQDGGMLVKPGFGGKRQGYAVDTGDLGSEAANEAASKSASRDRRGDRRDDRPTMLDIAGPVKPITNPVFGDPDPNIGSPVDTGTSFLRNLDAERRSKPFLTAASLINPVFGLPTLFRVAKQTGDMRKALGVQSPTPVDFSGMDRGEDIPLWAQLGFSSEAEYLAALARTQAPSITEQGTTTEDDKDGRFIRFRAEGGPIGGEYDFESARQMYGLGKLVKKVTRTVKKIAKSPVGKVAIAAGIAGIPFGGGKFFGSGSLFGKAKTFFGAGSFNPFKTAIEGVGTVSSPFGALASKAGLTNLVTGDLTGVGKAVLGLGVPAVAAAFLTPEQEEEAQKLAEDEGIDIEAARNSILARARDDYKMDFRARGFRAEGGIMRAGYQEGSKEPVAKKTMPLLDMGGKEMDLREDGGFVPIGRMEKADDVPARLSKNEFVFTADAVRNAGDGDVDKGAEVMYNMMKNLEAGGDVSEESQGLQGARRMFQTSQRLEEVL